MRGHDGMDRPDKPMKEKKKKRKIKLEGDAEGKDGDKPKKKRLKLKDKDGKEKGKKQFIAEHIYSITVFVHIYAKIYNVLGK